MPVATLVNESIDTGTSTVDYFADTDGVSAVWDFRITDGTNSRAGELRGDWDTTADSVPSQAIRRIKDIGAVSSDVTINLDKNVNTVRLRVYVPSDGWTFKALRHLVP